MPPGGGTYLVPVTPSLRLCRCWICTWNFKGLRTVLLVPSSATLGCPPFVVLEREGGEREARERKRARRCVEGGRPEFGTSDFPFCGFVKYADHKHLVMMLEEAVPLCRPLTGTKLAAPMCWVAVVVPKRYLVPVTFRFAVWQGLRNIRSCLCFRTWFGLVFGLGF